MSLSYEFGPFRLDPSALVLWRGKEVVPLAPKPLLLLKALVEQAGEAVTTQDLMARLWPDTHVHAASLSVAVAALRKALGNQPDGRSYVQTLARRGYRFDASLKGAPAPVLTLGVLPFQGIGAAADAAIGLGIADTLIARLTEIESLRVRPTGAVAHYASSPRPPEAAAQELGVDAVIDGTFQGAAGRLRVAVQLVPRTTRLRPWAERFEGEVDELFALQDELAERVAAAISTRLPGASPGAPAVHQPPHAALESYLRGRYLLSRLDLEGIAKAFGHFGESAQLDPDFAAARAGLASAHVIRAFGGPLPPTDAWSAAAECADEALALDPTSTEARVARGLIALFRDWDWAAARSELAKVVSLRPNAPGPRLWLGLLLCLRLDRAGARREVALAREADPLSLLGLAMMSLIHELDGDVRLARTLALRAIELHPDRFLGHLRLGAVSLRLGAAADAVRPLQRAVELTAGGPAAKCWLVRALAGAGRAKAARELLSEVEDLASTTYVTALHRGLGWWSLGERAMAITRIEEAVAVRDPWLVMLGPDPLLRELRSERRLHDLLAPVFA